MAVKVYSTPACPWCSRAKEYLKEHKIKFQDINVQADPAAAEERMEKSGHMGVPVLDIDGEIIVGFDKEKIRKILRIRD